jgi:hypothetical protein
VIHGSSKHKSENKGINKKEKSSSSSRSSSTAITDSTVSTHHQQQSSSSSLAMTVTMNTADDTEDDDNIASFDWTKVPISILRRYKSHFKLQSQPGMTKAQLAQVIE